ncbi:methyltransferase [Amycolatopsis sp. YIM 10]|uniref:methyltransferase n=1 Tax=Amycolatopsis sp. YIM 10 TaxID=2653857 RepID=UPI0012901D24|nr:methyltransferase [Amycolatopsis sp. YIM 10]QFU88096.1 Ribosomal protein L11 methyltransferase [Amycolatopsis sp. YIM 10]
MLSEPPASAFLADDTLRADIALRHFRRGRPVLWQGDFHGARQLLQALGRRTSSVPLLKMLLIPLEADYTVPLRRAPDVRSACLEAFGPATGPTAVPLRELLGVIGAHEWRVKGIEVPALGAKIHPHYGVFAPIRQEYLDLVVQAPVPEKFTAFDIGTGTGVLAALLARRGATKVVATDVNPRACACARENLERLGHDVEVLECDLFPPGRADLVVCNPPWVPGRAHSELELAIFDTDMLDRFLARLPDHLTPGGEGWLVLSDLAEHLGLRTREELQQRIDQAGLRVVDRLDTRPRHKRARADEITSLWRLQIARSRPAQ